MSTTIAPSVVTHSATITVVPILPRSVRSLEEYTQVGAAWLDVRYPGWADQIDLDKLDMGNNKNCIAGQLGRHWYTVQEEFTLDTGINGESLLLGKRQEWEARILERRTMPHRKAKPDAPVITVQRKHLALSAVIMAAALPTMLGLFGF